MIKRDVCVNNEIYRLYEEEVAKNENANKVIKDLKLEIFVLKSNLKISEGKTNKAVADATAPLIEKNNKLEDELSKAYEEIDRLKTELNNKEEIKDKDYEIDKLKNQINKDSSNSSIPTSKEIKHKNRTNTYNHRTPTTKTTGGQINHKGSTLTKEKIEQKIKENNLEVREFVHYVKGKSHTKYQVGIEINTYIEKHTFIHDGNSEDVLPKEFYSDVTYKEDVQALIILLGNYFSLPYNKIKEFLSDLTDGIINLSEGTIDNIYEKFSDKTDGTILNITQNLNNGKIQHTDETIAKENGKDRYYRGYANSKNVLYKYHDHKGDTPIKEDGILTQYYGTVISDHDTGMFKYGTHNQDCIVHFGRYCIEQNQNIAVTTWQMDLYRLLLKFERNRKIIGKFGATKFSKEDIKLMEKEYDVILQIAKEENEIIPSSYWKEKANTLLNRCIKYKDEMLFYIHDFSVDYDNNFMERALRMIKGKTKVSGGFRSKNGAIRFGNIMSIIKTSKLRKLNPFDSIKRIMHGENLFA